MALQGMRANRSKLPCFWSINRASECKNNPGASLYVLGKQSYASSSESASLPSSTNGSEAPGTPLLHHLKQKIMMRGGPISLAEFMQDALTHPKGGFYQRGDVFGTSGDFITSPEISQMFGEMVGAWAAYTWMQMGQPKSINLVEMGPGRGTLMADLLRATAGIKAFSAAVDIHMVEVSSAMRQLQWNKLKCSQPPASSRMEAANPPLVGAAGANGGGFVMHGVCGMNGRPVWWHHTLDAVPRSAPAIYIAHEFFDALPVHQFVKDPKRGWLEKMVDVDMRGAERQDGAAADKLAEAASTSTGSAEQQQQQQQHTSGSGLRLVLSPGTTPAAALLVPRRLRGIQGSGASSPATAAVTASGDSDSAEGSGASSTAADAAAESKPADSGASASTTGSTSASADGSTGTDSTSTGGSEITTIEVCAKGMAAAETLALRLGQHGGAALIIDYGKDGHYSDSLMAIRNHKGVEVLDDPGSADLSAWVDFASLRQAALESGAPVAVHGPVSQSSFLRQMGMEMRLQSLLKRATPAEAEVLQSGFNRLVDEGPNGMGRTYQVMAIAHKSQPAPAGLEK